MGDNFSKQLVDSLINFVILKANNDFKWFMIYRAINKKSVKVLINCRVEFIINSYEIKQ